ncbi:MAG: O-antigen ligase family protein [Clostridia bacterium]|nr:O-antigen ligase family protein [Clostridia bacterium]
MSKIASAFRDTSERSALYPLRRFLASDVFSLMLVALAFVFICFNWIIPGAFAMGIVASLILILSDDIVSIFLPVMLIASFGIQADDSLWDYMALAPLAAFPIFAFPFHHIVYRERDKSKASRPGALLLPMILVSITNFLGGIGTIPPESYFSPTSLVYMFALGFMIVIVYFLVYNHLGAGKNYTTRIDLRISKMACFLMLFIILAVAEGYVERWAKFIADPGILYFQWRNNASTLIMMAMPFAFYMSARKFRYIILPFIAYAAMIMLGSRGGLILGGLEFMALLIVDIILDKRHRKHLAGIFAVLFFGALFLFPQIEQLMEYTLGRMTAADQYSIRLGLWRRSVEDFHRNPIFGMGLGYMGNRDIHPSKAASLCWYHSSLPQVWGSFGIVGLLTYGYQMICRWRFLTKQQSMFGYTVIASFLGLELMSLVNPGIFAMFYLLIISMEFFILEKYRFPEIHMKLEVELGEGSHLTFSEDAFPKEEGAEA